MKFASQCKSMHRVNYQFSLKHYYSIIWMIIMEPKFLHLLSCILLLFQLNHFLCFSHANSPHQFDNHNSSGSALDFMKPLIGTRKGNTAMGLSQLKKYLTKFGYLNNNNTNHPSHEMNDLFDDNLELAIKKYQQFFKLTVNGLLDDDTIAKMQQPRCGVPDFFHDHNGNEIPYTGSSKYSFFSGSPKWPRTKRKLTYAFPASTRGDLVIAITRAMTMWSTISPFTFSYTPNFNRADIKVSMERGDHGDGNAFVGASGVLAHAFAPTDGRLHFNADRRWVYGTEIGAYDFLTVGLHEIGHILGLDHTHDILAIMYPSVDEGIRRGRFAQDDINGIKALYPS